MPQKFVAPKTGDLRTHVAIQQVTRTPDGLGSTTETWANITEAWARIDPWKGTSLLQAQVIRPLQWWELTIRFVPNIRIKKSMRIKDLSSGELFEIYSCADPDSHRHWLYLLVLSSTD